MTREDAGPCGASDGGARGERRILDNNSQPGDCQEEMHFP